jgi:4-amino-4-deoxy-L-arabinose transferase-like glycosyltransferase
VSRRTWIAVLAIAGATALARGLAFHGLDLYSDEAYYWLWSTRPATGYFDHPPMVAWLIWLSSRLVAGETGVRLLFLLLGGLTVLFAALAARELERSDRAALLGAVLVAGAPMLHLAGAMALPDGPVLAGYTAAVWLLARARGPRWLAAGVAVGFALLGKYTAAMLAPALLLLVAWDRELRQELRGPWPWLGGAAAVLLFLPNLLWIAEHGWTAIGFQLRHGFRVGQTLRAFLEYLGAQLGSPGPVAAVLGIWLALRARSSAEKRVAAAVLVPLAVITWSATRGDVEANWPALVYPGLCALGAAWLARRSPRLGWSLAGLQLGLATLVLVGFAVEVRHPRLLAGSVVVSRFRSGSGLGRGMVAAAEESCRAIGDPPGCARDPFVYPSSYQYAGHLAYYAGWRRLGPAEERPSQLDLWDERPRPGEPFLYAGQVAGAGGPFREQVRFTGEGPMRSFDVTWRGRVVRQGNVTAFARYQGGQLLTRPPRPP